MYFEFCITTSASAQSLVSIGAHQLVMPFENETHELRYDWLAEGAASLLTEDLTALGAKALSREDRLRAFEHLRVPATNKLSEATIIRVAQIVGAEQVITGSFAVNGTSVTIHARPIRLDTGRRFPEITETGALTELFETFARAARRLLPASVVLTSEMERAHPPLAAFEEYIKGAVAENPSTQIVFFKEALRYAPDFHQARLALWSVYTEQGEHRQALGIVQQVPSTHPLSRQARFRAALSTMSLGRHAEAIDLFTALNREQRDPALLNDAGVAELRRTARSPDGSAADLFGQALMISPDDADLTFNLGYAAWLAHDTLTAVRWLREAVRRNPADDAAHWVLGVALQASANTAEGQRERDLAKRLASKYVEWEKQRGVNALPPNLERVKSELDAASAPRIDAAIAAAEQRDQRDVAAFHLENGRRLYQGERDAEAIAELRRAIYLSPYEREAHLLLGRLYLRAGQIADAIDELKISIWSDDQTDARVTLARAYLQAKNVDGARSELQTVLTREPSNSDARRLLSTLPTQ
ncbi:MAG TPA: tetratricopeptide repeat protein [Vicinamibacterales bacterium]|nr:tetratricopeptide repeat protein [Vicinamibacterales bacterium]